MDERGFPLPQPPLDEDAYLPWNNGIYPGAADIVGWVQSLKREADQDSGTGGAEDRRRWKEAKRHFDSEVRPLLAKRGVNDTESIEGFLVRWESWGVRLHVASLVDQSRNLGKEHADTLRGTVSRVGQELARMQVRWLGRFSSADEVKPSDYEDFKSMHRMGSALRGLTSYLESVQTLGTKGRPQRGATSRALLDAAREFRTTCSLSQKDAAHVAYRCFLASTGERPPITEETLHRELRRHESNPGDGS